METDKQTIMMLRKATGLPFKELPAFFQANSELACRIIEDDPKWMSTILALKDEVQQCLEAKREARKLSYEQEGMSEEDIEFELRRCFRGHDAIVKQRLSQEYGLTWYTAREMNPGIHFN